MFKQRVKRTAVSRRLGLKTTRDPDFTRFMDKSFKAAITEQQLPVTSQVLSPSDVGSVQFAWLLEFSRRSDSHLHSSPGFERS